MYRHSSYIPDEEETGSKRDYARYYRSISPSKELTSEPRDFYDETDFIDHEDILRFKWMDQSPRMSRVREHRQRRLLNKLEQFERWDSEQQQKQRQFDLARVQRIKNISERLKSQDFCYKTMKKRHEDDLEAIKDLEMYENEHLFIDALDDPKKKYQGPLTQYRKFEAEMNSKMKELQDDFASLNPRFKIEQVIIPRLERSKVKYSDPVIYTSSGRRILRKPFLDRNRASSVASTNAQEADKEPFMHDGVKYYFDGVSEGQIYLERLRKEVEAEKAKNLKPIIHSNANEDTARAEKRVNFKEEAQASASDAQSKQAEPPKQDA